MFVSMLSEDADLVTLFVYLIRLMIFLSAFVTPELNAYRTSLLKDLENKVQKNHNQAMLAKGFLIASFQFISSQSGREYIRKQFPHSSFLVY